MKTFTSYAEMADVINGILLAEFQKGEVDPKYVITFTDDQQKYLDKIIEAHRVGDFESWFKLSATFNEMDLNCWKIPEMGEMKQACTKVVKDRNMMRVYWDALNEAE